MAKQKKLNKNLIATLTLAVMLVAVVVVFMLVTAAARRNPEAIAEKARLAEKNGDLQRALQQYDRAFKARKESKYLLDQSRVAMELGEVGYAIGRLELAFKQSPDDVDVVTTLLEKAWEFRGIGWPRPEDAYAYAEALLKLQPENVLGIVSLMDAAETLKEKDQAKAKIADEMLAKAMKIDANNDRLALVRATREIRDVMLEFRGKRLDGVELQKANQKLRESQDRAVALLKASIEAHPKNDRLYTGLASLLRQLRRTDEARQTLEQGVAAIPDNGDLRYALSEVLCNDVLRVSDPASKISDAATVDAAIAQVNKAIELERTNYGAFSMRALLTERKAKLDGAWDKDSLSIRKSILEALSKAMFESASYRSLKAVLGGEARERMFAEGFDLAMRYYDEVSGADDKKAMMGFVQRIADDTRAQFKESVFVPLMDGRIAIAKDDSKSAIKAFEEAERRAGTERPLMARLAKEQLTRIHRKENHQKISLDYADEALKLYEQMQQPPPLWLMLHRADLLLSLARAQEALDLLEPVKQQFPDNPDLAALLARILAVLGRANEAIAEFKGGDDRPALVLEKARIVGFSGDLKQAADLVRSVLDKDADNADALKLYAQILSRGSNGEESANLIGQYIPKAKQETTPRVIKTYQILLTTKDPADREKKVLALIEETPNPCDKQGEYFNYYLLKREYEKALPYLDEVEKCKGMPELDIAKMKFFVLLQLNQPDKAEPYADKLTKANADRADGAMYRGQLKMARGDLEGALSEFRTAERAQPSDAEIKTRIAEALIRSKPPRLEEAVTALKQAVDFDPRNFALNRLLYTAYEQLNKRDEGLPYLQVAAEINPNDEFVKDRMALLEESKDPAKGITRREAQLAQKADDLENLLRLVELYEKAGDIDKAQERMQQAQKLQPDNPAVARSAARFYSVNRRRIPGETYLREFTNAAKGAIRIDAMILLARYFESFDDRVQANQVLLDAARTVDDIAAGDISLRDRARAAINLALADFYGRAAADASAKGQSPTQDLMSQADALRTVLTMLKPDDVDTLRDTRIRLIQTLVTAADYEKADKEIQKFRQEYPKEIRGMIAEADLLLRRATTPDVLDKAKEILGKVLQEKPDHVFSLLMRARVYMAQNKYTEARDDLLRCKKVNPKALAYEPRMELIRVYDAQGQLALAESEARELLKELPGERRVIRALMSVLERANKSQESLALVNEYIAKEPKDPLWRYQAARLLMDGKNFTAAVDNMKAAVDLSNGTNAELIAAWFDALNKAGRSREVLSTLPRLDANAVTPRVRSSIVDAHMRLNDKASAMAEFQRGLSQGASSNIDELSFLVGICEPIIGRDAIIDQLRATLQGQTSEMSSEQRMQFEMRLKSMLGLQLALTSEAAKQQEGLRVIEEVLSKSPKDSKLRYGAALIKASALERSNDAKAAAEVYNELLKLNSSDVQVLNNLAFLYVEKLNQPALALKYAEQANLLKSGDSNILDTLGWAYFKNNNAPRAEATLTEAVRLNPSNPTPYWHLYQLYSAAGRASDARRQLERMRDAAKESNDPESQKKAEDALAGK